MVVNFLMRTTWGEIFNIKYEDNRKVKKQPHQKSGTLKAKNGSRALNTTIDAVRIYKNLKEPRPIIQLMIVLYFLIQFIQLGTS